MTDELILRAVREGERDSLIELMKSAIRHNCVEAYGLDTVDAWLDDNTSRFDFRIPEHCFVAELGGRTVAFAGWRPQVEEDGLARVTAVFVAPGNGRRGLGRAVMERVERHIAEKGFRRIHLFASLNAVPLYLSLGYEELAREHTIVAEGRKIELVRMARGVDTSTETN